VGDQVADARAAIAWVRAHAAEFGGDPGRLFLTGSSAGVNLIIRAIAEGETGIAGVIGRYGYYGELPVIALPPTLLIHGQNDLWVPAADVRDYADRLRATSPEPVSYVELPGAHHDFDLVESIRSAAISQAVARFMGIE
jgi:acetyl esterase/lipase